MMKNTMKCGLAAAALFLSAGMAVAQDALTITGGIRPRTQYNLDEGTGYANLSSGPGSASFVRFSDKVTPDTTIVLKFGTPYTDAKSGSDYNSSVAASNSWLSGVGVQEAYAVTDILGELKMNQVVGLKLQAGMFRLKPAMFSRGLNFGFGTGDEGSRAEIFNGFGITPSGFSYESYKWAVEVPVNALKNVFPLSFRAGSDLDLTGHGERTGFTAYAEASGRNLYLLNDRFVVDWVTYYSLKQRDAAPQGTPYIDAVSVAGGQVSLGFGFANGLSVGLGAAADYASYTYNGQWHGTGSIREYTNEGTLNWQAGSDLTFKDFAKVYGAFVHRNALSVAIQDADGNSITPYDYSQDFVSFRADCLLVKGLTPYVGGSYVLANQGASDSWYSTVYPDFLRSVDAEVAGAAPLSWEAGVMAQVGKSLEIDAGVTHGDNRALATFGAVLNAIEQQDGTSIFCRAGWKF